MPITFSPEVERADEAFWQRQENRKRGLLGQPCCTQSKMSWAAMGLPGPLAVVIHGEYDCLNCFHHHQGINAHNFFSTRLSDHQLTTGTTHRPLEHLLRLIVDERQPEAILVLGTCPVEVIGDRFERVTERVEADTGVPILALHTSGLKLSSLTACQDWLFASLATLADPAARDLHPHTLNLIGLPARAPEPVALLADVGLTVQSFLPHGAALSDWQQILRAGHSFVVDRRVFPRLLDTLTEQGQQVHDVPLPVGWQATRRFYEAIGEATGTSEALRARLDQEQATHEPAIAAFRQRYGGARLGFAIRILNTSQVDQIVQDGLGDLTHLLELGLAVELLIQGPPEEGERFAARLATRGIRVPSRPFRGPFDLGEALQAGGYDAVIVPDSNRNIARRAGLPMLSSRALRPWLSGIATNLRVLADLLDEGAALRSRS